MPDNPVALSEFDAGLPALLLAHLALYYPLVLVVVVLELVGGVYLQVPIGLCARVAEGVVDPLGLRTNEPAWARTISPPTSKVNPPSNTKAHSSSRAWVCGGIIWPGGRPTSMIVKAPPKLSFVTLWVMSKTARWAPSCGPMKIFLLAATECSLPLQHLTQGYRTLAGRLEGSSNV
jgi:hypothetical protein